VNAASAAARWLDEIVLGNFYTELVGRLTAFYGTKPDSAALDSGRVAIGLWARDQLEGPVAAQLHKMKVSKRPGGPVNNARLVGALIYRTKLQLFEDWYERYGANIAESVRALRELEAGAEGKGAYERLEKALAP